MLRASAKNAGFTLLEVMIAVAVIALAVVTLLGAQSHSVSLASSARFDTMASLLAQWKMADLMVGDADRLADDSGNFGADYPQFSWNLKVSDLAESETGLPGTDGLLKALEITVRSDQDSGAECTLRTIVCTRPTGKPEKPGGPGTPSASVPQEAP